MALRAVIAGVSGIVGSNLAALLVSKGWEVHGLARRPETGIPGVRPIAADLLKPESLRAALAGVDPTHVFFATWLRQATEAENCAVNGAMVRNLLSAFDSSDSLRHVALVTGLKHYLGPFESYASQRPETPFREEMPRMPVENFYYTQEDEVFEAARRRGFTWSVHRPHTIIGYALGNAMNMGVTLAVYAAICRETGRPFVFPGSVQQWEGLTDVTDARILARHLEWAATSDAARNEAFNIVNGDVFRWKWLWPKLATDFGIDVAPYPGRPTPLDPQLAGAGPVWAEIAAKYGLAQPDLDKLASAWHTDLDLGREMEVVTDMTKSRVAGFSDYQPTLGSFLDLFARLREDRIIP
ncbi:MAG: SDR family oxidoreductase [Paludisphaera borealis]|uniref:SDR family oxidoreductase n=1 Tax=Paludisphaera borealis TaxID=1387353 RepID=UPI00284D1620|nr:SDR family oxidoreductase [Paludisphaera borealis]MDR3623380.1 SDR family oxidoreductase [Paludisphaera borealis]